ncbi:MAG TPA: carbonic anhydrase [Woeseiaceae bacterium]
MQSAEEAIARLRRGNRRFIEGNIDQGRHVHRSDLVDGQRPFAIVLACSDSRVPVETVFDQGLGDLFVIRIAGNIVAPSQIGSIEFATTAYGTRLVVVLGHSNCGAIAATLDDLSRDVNLLSPFLRVIVDRVRPAVEPVLAEHGGKIDVETMRSAVLANVRASVAALRHGSEILKGLTDEGKLTIVGAKYSIATGEVLFLED